MALTEQEARAFGSLGVQQILVEPGPPLEFDKAAHDRNTLDATGYVLLIRIPGDPDLYGPVENSFSLGIEKNWTQFFWNSRWHDKDGNLRPAHEQIDGREWALRDLARLKRNHPTFQIDMYDVRDPNLPVVIDWKAYCRATEPARSLSGVRDKYGARNLKFFPAPERVGL